MTEGATSNDARKVPILSLFADVHEGEAARVLALTFNVFVLLCAYYLLKVAREPLILLGGGGGAEVKSYASAGQALILSVLTPAYGALASRLSRIKLITSVTLFFVANLAVFAMLVKSGASIGVPFFLWVGIFNMLIVAQFWAFAADLYTNEQGKRLFPIIGVGSTLGAIGGSALARSLNSLGPATLMTTAAVMIAGSLALTVAVNRGATRDADAATRKQAEAPIGGPSGLSLLFGDRYVVGITALMVLINCVNTLGEYILDVTILANAPLEAAVRGISAKQYVGEFRAEFFFYVNVAVALVQMFVVSRVIKHLGLMFALVVVPLVSLAGYLSIALTPVLVVVSIAKIAENSLDYSLQNTARQALWLVTSRTTKYKAKVIVDTFFVRMGDTLSGGIVWVVSSAVRLGARQVPLVNAALVGAWLVVAFYVARANRARAATRDEHARAATGAEAPA